MISGALIVAAGKPIMTDPMDIVGSITVAQRAVSVFRQAGITRIAVVTGYNAVNLEKHLASNHIVFLRNDEYENTRMFDSVRLGIEYMMGKVDALVISPMDAPLFTSETVKKVLCSGWPIAVPLYDGKEGHPVLVRKEMFSSILAYNGEDGLRGAIKSCGAEVGYISVDDMGITMKRIPCSDDAVLNEHNKSLLRPELSISLAREKAFLDEQMAMLLTLISETGSVREASERMQISYSGAWNLIKNLESQLSHTLIERTQGGSRNGRSRITDYGRKLLESYAEYSERIREYAAELFECYFTDI